MDIQIQKQEYCCFLHPEEKGQSLEQKCPKCGERFDFPLKYYPKDINGREVLEGHSRGFYGAILVTQQVQPLRKYAVKIIPKNTYEVYKNDSHKNGQEKFIEEATLHGELTGIGLVADLFRYGEADFSFHGHIIPCYYMEMEYIEGNTLADLVKGSSQLSPRIIGQIALDLLDFIGEFQQRGKCHNDLHGYNIKIKELKEIEARRRALQPNITIKVLDLGSVADYSKSDPEKDRLGDIQWVARHIFNLLNAYERSPQKILPEELRQTAQLRRVAELYCARDHVRLPNVDDMRANIEAAFRFGSRPWVEPVRLEAVNTHYNAQTLPAHFVPSLLYDPEDKWVKRLMHPGPQLLTGMRGCGKTMLLRSLEFSARAYKKENESNDDVLKRIQDDNFLGLFISSSSLLEGPRQQPISLLIHRLFLSFAREAIRDFSLCELNDLGSISYQALSEFNDFIKNTVPWYESPTVESDALAIEKAISRALQAHVEKPEDVPILNPRNAFDALTKAVRQLLDIWINKKLLFLLDDVSTRYLLLDTVNQLLKELSIQSPDFGIVITTERQTLEVTTPGGGTAREGRDFNVFDLGEEVLGMLRGKQGLQFVESILQQRIKITDNTIIIPPSEVLGRQTLNDIAKEIRKRPKPQKEKQREKVPPIYWGLDVLAGMCVGDIGDILHIYSRMLERANGNFPINSATQDSIITTYADDRLLMLAGLEAWLYSHAVAFAQASYNQLQQSHPDRLRQYAEVFVRIDPETTHGRNIFTSIIRLIDEGIFVFTGSTSRTKTPRGKPSLLFKLAFRKLLGATNRIPLSTRDRFELSGTRLHKWITHPTADVLELGVKHESDTPEELSESKEKGEYPKKKKVSSKRIEKEGSQSQFYFESDIATPGSPSSKTSTDLKLLFDVQTVKSGILPRVKVDWDRMHIVAAIGFEDRTIGTWENILNSGKPAGITLLRYPNPGKDEELFKFLSSKKTPWNTIKVEPSVNEGIIQDILTPAGNLNIVIDTTSLTKSLIFELVSNSLLNRGEAWILHTCAADYYPQDSDVNQALSLFERKDYPKAFEHLDKIVAGEEGPFSVHNVGEQFLDPSQPSYMVAFVALKHNRIEQILEKTPVERIAAIAPIHSDGRETPRSQVGTIMAKYLAERYGGDVYSLGSLNHEETYRLLIELYKRYSLDSGFNFEIALSGTKLQIVGAAMLASVAIPNAIYYSSPAKFDPAKFTKGTAETRLIHIKRVEKA